MTGMKHKEPYGDKPRFFYGYIVVTVALLIVLVGFGANSTFGIFFTPLLNEFSWTRAITAGAFSLSWIMHGLFSIVMGRLNDRFGSRLVMTACGALLAAGFLLMSQISTAWQLYLFYGVMIGISMGGFYIPMVSTVARWFVKRRGMMTGIVVSGVSIGTLIAPPVANWLISTYDWRLSYIIIGITVSFVVLSTAQLLKRDPVQVGQLPDGAHTRATTSLEPVFQGFFLKEAVFTKQFWLVFGICFCAGFCAYVIVVHIAPHAIELGTTATTAANILATVGGVSTASRLIMGSVVDRIGSKQALIIGFLLMAGALLGLVLTRETWTLYLFAAVYGFAHGSCDVPLSPLVASLFGLRSHGLIFGVIGSGFAIGSAVGPLVAGYIFDATNSYQVAFLICAVIATVGLILAAVLRQLPSPKS